MDDTLRRVILITGCSSGIGRAAAERFARRGHVVYATARRAESLEELRAWAGRQGDHVRVERLDVQDGATIHRAVQRVRDETGRCDVVVNNAGCAHYGAVEEITDAEMLRQFDVNLFGVLRVVRAVAPVMREQKEGRIINVSSIAAHLSLPFMGAYCASKHALDALSGALRVELAAWNIKVILVEPGPVATPFQEKASRSDGPSPYAAGRARMERIRREMNARMRAPMERVVGVIERAATSPRPRVRYTDAAAARCFPMLYRLLPDRVLDAFTKRVTGL